MKKFMLSMMLLCLMGFAGCAGFMRAPVVPPLGGFFNNTTAPLAINLDKVDLADVKSGEAKIHCILGLATWGDGSIQAAAKAGQVQTVHHADYRFFNVLGVYSCYTTVVYGR